MGTVVVKRAARRPAPPLPSGDVVLDQPPELPQASGRAWLVVLTSLPMVAGSAAMALLFSFTRPGPLGYLTGAIFGISMLGMFLVQIVNQTGQPSKGEMVAARRKYLRHLARHRRKIRRTIVEQRRSMFYRHPDPQALWSTATAHRLWERRGTDADFGLVRIGLGPLECATPLVPPDTKPVEELEPMCAMALRRFVKTYSVVPDLPVALALRGFSRVHVQGEPARCRALIRALLAQVATFHAPEDILVAVCCAPESQADWEWAKWLPHALHPAKSDALGQLRLVAPTVTALEAMLDDVLAARPRFNPDVPALDGTHVVLVLDGGDTTASDHVMTEGGIEGVTLVDLTTAPKRLLERSTLVLEIDEAGDLHSATVEGRERIGRPDTLSQADAEALARVIAPLRLSVAGRGETALAAAVSLSDLVGLGDPRGYDPQRFWAQRPNRDRLRVPIGVGPDGEPVDLDLKESAQDGMGPHGLLVGATGSGKSELLRTLVLGLATTHSSEVLNFILVDYKGGATFVKLDRLPHTSAVITNLADEIALVDRMHDAISGELIRRQELLRRAGNFNSQRDYERARNTGAPLAPLPSLLIICDEFSELLTARPDFIDMFVQIGRVGRSLGVHLLLGSQRLDDGRLRGLDTHLSYRIALRTLSTMESRVVLGVTDAFELPRAPGHALLATSGEPLTRFRAAYVSGAYRSTGAAHQRRLDPRVDQVITYGVHYLAPPADPVPADPQAETDDATAESELDILVDRLHGRGAPAHQVWLPPLSTPPTLDALLPPLLTDSQRGLTAADPDVVGALQTPVAVVDRPFEQRRDALWLDLAGAAGHVAVVGAPQTGKSTTLRTLVTGLALTHTPEEAQFYCLDFGGGGLAPLRDLPHVGGVAGRRDLAAVRRTVAELMTILRDREELFAAHGVDSAATYRRLRRSGQFPDDPLGDVFLVIDGWLTLRTEFEDLEQPVLQIANRGLSFGLHLVLSAARWADVRPALRDSIGSRIELRLGDPTDSGINRRAAMNVPEGAPGRGLTPDGFHSLGALPCLGEAPTSENLAQATTNLVDAIRGAWPGKTAPAVRLLPALFEYSALPSAAGGDQRVPVGIAETDLQPIYLDFASEPHFMLFGDVECGKTAFLRAVAHGIVERYDPAKARILLVDHRRTLLGVVPPTHLMAYGTSGPVTTKMITDVVQALRQRLPGPDVTAEQLRSRSWWRGPEVFILVDDYDLITSSATNPLAPIAEFVAQARDVGLHLVVTRRIGGAGRALYEPLLARMRESATPGLVMSGSPDEGPLLGNARPQPLPAGRGRLVGRRGSQLVQLAWLPPPE